MKIASRISKALQHKLPIVALESTIISHGMPYPQNLKTALDVQSIISSNGAVPSTIAIIKGTPIIGLDSSHIQFLAAKDSHVLKCSRRDLPYLLATHQSGSTTVSATMLLAHKAGLSLFATGGIGGVHRGAESSFDISADLTELAKTPVSVVCSGVKSILDIPKTLEYLETQGVTVISYKNDQFPAFFSVKSGKKAPGFVENAYEAAKIVFEKEKLGLENGIVIAVPNPDPVAGQEIQKQIQKALQSANQNNISGNDVTPYVLKRLHKVTEGKSLKANISLIKKNAQVAAQIAVELQKLRNSAPKEQKKTQKLIKSSSSPKITSKSAADKKVLVVGGAGIDLYAKSKEQLSLHTSNPGTLHKRFGGVGRNIAQVLGKLGANTTLLSVVGGIDNSYSTMLKYCQEQCNIDISNVQILPDAQTGTYISAIGPQGQMKLAVAAMDIFERMDQQFIINNEGLIHQSDIIVADGNLHPSGIKQLALLCRLYKIPLVFEPTSVEKASLVLKAECLGDIDFISPNEYQMGVFLKNGQKQSLFDIQSMKSYLINYKERIQKYQDYQCFTDKSRDKWNIGKNKYLLLKYGKLGSALCRINKEQVQICQIYDSEQLKQKVKNVNGAGDTMIGALIRGYIAGLSPIQSFNLSNQAVKVCLQSQNAIPDEFPSSLIKKYEI